MRDFNEIFNLSKKWGAITRANGQTEAFRRTLEDCQLRDLGFKEVKGAKGMEVISLRKGWIERWLIQNGKIYLTLWRFKC